jgi:hypothetical protein
LTAISGSGTLAALNKHHRKEHIMPPRRRQAAKAAPAPEPEAIEELDDLEEIGEDDALEELVEEEAPKPAKRTTKAAAAKAAPAKATKAATKSAAAAASERSEFDSNWLAAYVTEETGVEYDSRAIRMLLRKLAKDGLLAREIGEDRSRYDFPKGANDPIVKQVIKLVNTGEAKAVQQAGLAEAKASKATKAAAPAKAAAKTAPPAKATTARRRRTTVAE